MYTPFPCPRVDHALSLVPAARPFFALEPTFAEPSCRTDSRGHENHLLPLFKSLPDHTMASRGLLQSTMMTPRLVARSSLQHVNHPAVVMRSTLGRKLASTTSTASGGRTRSGPFKSYPRMTMAAAALLGGAAYIAATRDAEPLQASTAATLDLDPNDPLSALYPHILHASTSHLDDLPLGTLIKTYIVYLGSSQSALVEAGPWMLQKLEWARDNVPIVGNTLWSAFAVVSAPSDALHRVTEAEFHFPAGLTPRRQ